MLASYGRLGLDANSYSMWPVWLQKTYVTFCYKSPHEQAVKYWSCFEQTAIYARMEWVWVWVAFDSQARELQLLCKSSTGLHEAMCRL